MADTVAVTAGAGTTIATDDIGGVHYQRVKIVAGVDGVARRDWSGEMTPYHLISAASINATVVKASAGHLGYIIVTNINAAARYLKFYNKATTPAPATDTAVLVLVVQIPPSSLTPQVITFPDPIYFSSGISFATVTGIADANATAVSAAEHTIGLGYQ